MSYKTDNLADLFPRIYAARESESILYKLLDTIAAEMMTADARIKFKRLYPVLNAQTEQTAA